MSTAKCKWCKYNPGCDDSCDFRSLKYDKDAIIDRMKEELDFVKALTKEIEKAENIDRISDKLYGVSIMSQSLREDFGVKDAEIGRIVGSKMSIITKAKLASKLMKMKKERGKK